MTENTSLENLRKFLKSKDPAMVRMGISLAKGAGVEVTAEDLKHFLKNENIETVKTGIMLADEAGVGDEAMEMLCVQLEIWGDNDDVADVLGEIGDARAVEALAEVIFDEWGVSWRYNEADRQAESAVIEALGKIGDASAIDHLISALEIHCEELGEKYAEAETVREGFGYGWRFFGGHITDAIIQIGSQKAIEPLLGALDSGIEGGDWFLPELAAEALTSLGWKPETDEQKASYLIATEDWEGCKKTGEPLVTKAVLYLVGRPLFQCAREREGWMCDAGTRVLEAIDSFGETAIKILKADEKYGEDRLERFHYGKEVVEKWK